MAITLLEMRENVALTCTNVAITGDGIGAGVSPSNLDRAIRWAGNRWMRETKSVRSIATKATVAATETIDPSTMTDFLPGCLLSAPYIASLNRKLWVVDLSTIINKRNLSSSSGVPEMIAFASSSVAHLYPTPDAIYTLSFHYWLPLTTFTIGADNPSAITLNIPDRYADDIALGAAGHVIRPYPGIPNGGDKLGEFERAIQRAKGEAAEAGVWFSDEPQDLGNSYAREMRV